MIARAFRLREEHDVQRVRNRGRATARGPLVARMLPNQLDPAQNRYTVIAGKRCGKAVERNRLKRLVREALRGMHPALIPGTDVVIIVRGDTREMPNLTAAQQALHTIFTRAGLFADPATAPRPGEPVTAGWVMVPRPGETRS